MSGKRIRLLSVWACLLAGSPAARAGEDSAGSSAALGGLEVRLLPAGGRTDEPLVAGVGRPFAVRYEVRNGGDEPLLLPLAHPHFVRGQVRYVDASAEAIVEGRAWGPAPTRSALIELAPGGTRVETFHVTPACHGRGRVRLSLQNGHGAVTEIVPVRRPLGGGVESVRAGRRLVPEPHLWKGHLHVEAAIDVVFTSGYGEGEALDPRTLATLWTGEMSLLERLDALGRVGVLDPSSRGVDLFRKGFARRSDGPAWPVLVRLECAKQLALAARKGYGWHGLKTLLSTTGNEDEDESVRLLALEGAALALSDRLRATAGDCRFDLALPPEWKEEATLLFATLAERTSPLGRRAKAILDARGGSGR
jgi:hypothetical protein